jgi:sulfatase modifying factor 1
MPATTRFGIVAISTLAATITAIATSPAFAAPRDEWATITHAGNAPYVYQDFDLTIELGRVDHEYQIRKTEVTAGEWFEFVQAYAPYVPVLERIDSGFTSQFVGISYNPDNTVGYFLYPQVENRAVEVGWRNAARFCNWLHNDKASTREAFEFGAYDTSTFGQKPDGTITDQASRSTDSRYWLPSDDEWVKAAYFDPNKNGTDQAGYWLYPNGTDQPLSSGVPGVGQTSAGWYGSFSSIPEVGAYANVTSPWGLWDLSGGESEWCDGFNETTPLASRPFRGSAYRSDLSFLDDRINARRSVPVTAATMGIRIAREVPPPSAWTPVLAMPLIQFQRRSRS